MLLVLDLQQQDPVEGFILLGRLAESRAAVGCIGRLNPPCPPKHYRSRPLVLEACSTY